MTKAMLVPIGEEPRTVSIDGLKDLQKLVGGHIECMPWVFDDEPTIYVNDEGKFTCSPNRAVYATANDAGRETWDGKTIAEGDVLDIIFSDFVCVGFDRETGEDRDITEEEMEKVMKRFGGEKSIVSGMIEAMRIAAKASTAAVA